MKFIYISENFKAVKPAAILVVTTSHYWGGLWWVPTVIALFLFGFASGFFTATKYDEKFVFATFWKNKLYRLLPRLLTINVFLALLFIWQDRSGIFTWHTLPHLLGMSGFLNWLHIDNSSPFGLGLWFFTLLLLFYAIYPFLFLLKNIKYAEQLFLTLALFLVCFLQFRIEFGYQLWPTAYSFVVGCFYAKKNIKLGPLVIAGSCTALFFLIVYLNVIAHFTRLNFYLLLALSILLALFLLTQPLPRLIVAIFSWLNGVVLEIYFIHQYMFIEFTSYSRLISFVISMALIIAVAFALSYLGNKLEQLLSLP